MSSVPVVKSREVITAMRTFGFEVDHQTGSHCILKKPGHRYVLSVPIHGAKGVSKGVLRNILQAAEVSVDAFVAALK